MSISDKELEEAGKKLLDQTSSSSVDQLLSILDNVVRSISVVDQLPPRSTLNALSPFMEALVAPELLNHSNLDVKVSVAACITQLSRITAPDLPYDDGQMKEVSQLIVSSFQHLYDMSSRSYANRTLILDTVSALRFCNAMLNPECYALLIEMFHHFLEGIRDHHTVKVFLDMVNIMTHVLEDIVDIPPEMLLPILRYVKKDSQIPPVSRRLAEQVLISCATELKTNLAEAVKSSGISLDNYSYVLASICEGAFSKQNAVVANKKDDLHGPTELALKHDKQDAPQVSTSISSLDGHEEALSPRREIVAEAGVRTRERTTVEITEDEEDVAEISTGIEKRARVGEAHGETEKTAPEGESDLLHFNSCPIDLSAKKTMKRRLGNEDRISHLPEELLLHILSLLPTKLVVATSLLSKQWRSLWKMVAKLEFDCHKNQSKHDTFSEIVCRVLLSQKAPVLERLRIDFGTRCCRGVDIGMWIGIAYARHVRELVLNVESEEGKYKSFKLFKAPKSLFNCETLETLELSAGAIVDVPSKACLKSLRTLHLRHVGFIDDRSFPNLLSGCPNLETMVLRRNQWVDDAKIFTIAVPTLQRLTICDNNDGDEFEGYVLNAPSLKYLKIGGSKALKCGVTVNAPELVEANIVNVITHEKLLVSLTSVKRLSLALSPLEITFPTGSIFTQLVHLELSTHKAQWWNLLLLMLDSSPNLRVLKLIEVKIKSWYRYWRRATNRVVCEKWSQPKKVPECLLFHLETFVCDCYKGLEEEKEVVKYILRNTSRLKRATVSTKPFGERNSQEMMEEFKSVVRASNSCELVLE